VYDRWVVGSSEHDQDTAKGPRVIGSPLFEEAVAALHVESGMARLVVFSALQSISVSPFDVTVKELDRVHDEIDRRLATLGLSEERRAAAIARLTVISIRRAQTFDADTARGKHEPTDF
jgi:hypothetical protein